MGKHLVLAGGGHAHLMTLLKLGEFVKRGHRVTLISPSDYHYYSGMGPGLLSGIYESRQVRFHIRKMTEARGGAFIKAKVLKIDPEHRKLLLDSGSDVEYDVVSFNTGSEVPLNIVQGHNGSCVTVKPINNLEQVREAIIREGRQRPLEILVAGGGPAGVEIAGNLWRLVQERRFEARINLVGGSRILGGFPDKVRELALKSLEGRGIVVTEGMRVKSLDSGEAVLSDGTHLPYDFAFLALGIIPSSFYRESGLPVGPDGGLLVNSYLQSVAFPEIFGGGDCISLQGNPLAKVGVYAVRQNPVLYRNLLAALQGDTLVGFSPQSSYLLILNMGDGKGIFHKKGWVWHGRLAFVLKDWIDRRFMRKFQVSGELRDFGKENA